MCPGTDTLSIIAAQLGQEEAVRIFREAGAKEEAGDCLAAIPLYKKAFRLWPELDSTGADGLPRAVRKAAEAAGSLPCPLLRQLLTAVVCPIRIDCEALVDASAEHPAAEAREQQLYHMDAEQMSARLADVEVCWLQSISS